MRTITITSLLYFATLIVTQPAFADAPNATASQSPPSIAAPSPLTPDRPGFTNGSDVVLVDRTQVEIGAAWTKANSASGSAETGDEPEMLIRHGVTPKLEWRVAVPDYFRVTGGSSGFGDGLVGVKYKYFQSKDGNTKAAITPALSIPAGSNVFGTGHVDPYLTLAVQTTSGARWGLSTNLQLGDPTVAGRRVEQVAPAASASYQITSALSAYVDAYHNFPRTGGSSPVADGGITFLVNPNLQYDAEFGYGLGGSAPARFAGGGVSVRF